MNNLNVFVTFKVESEACVLGNHENYREAVKIFIYFLFSYDTLNPLENESVNLILTL